MSKTASLAQERTQSFTTLKIIGGFDTDKNVDLDVYGGMRIRKRLHVAGNIEAGGDISSGGDLSATGNVNAGGDINALGDVNVNGDIIGGGDVIVDGSGVFGDNVYVNNTLYVNLITTENPSGNIIIDGNLTILGNLVAQANLIYGPVAIVDRLVKVSGTDKITETGIVVDSSNNVSGINDLTINGEATFSVINVNISLYPLQPAGSIVYDILSKNIYYSNGLLWLLMAAPTILPPPLLSIAGLTTAGNEMIYTIATDTYATSPISPAGRSFVSLVSSSAQRTALGLVIGTDVQAQSTYLDTVNTIAAGPANRIIQTTGPGLTSVSISPFASNTLLQIPSASVLANTISAVKGSLTILNALPKVTAGNSLIESGIIVDGSNNVTGINDININNTVNAINANIINGTIYDAVIANANIIYDIVVGGDLDGITPQERTQLRNIDTTVISSTTWGYLGSIDQSLSTTSTPTFNGISASNQLITNVLNPVSNQDAATKSYVDTVATTGAPPLVNVRFATAGPLPNTPIYSNTFQTITSTSGGGFPLIIDGNITTVTDNGVRILVKDQSDNRENGIYTLSDYGGGLNPWQLLRSSDFNQAAMPRLAGSSLFVQAVPGTTNGATNWALQTTVFNINPLSDPVVWILIGGSVVYSPGNGIDSVQLSSGTIATRITGRLKYTSGALDLNTISTPYGGTGVAISAGTTNAVAVTNATNGTNPMNFTKQAPTGDFVGTTDSQSLSNKSISSSSITTTTITSSTITSSTNSVRATLLGTSSVGTNVTVNASTPPTAGQVLTATASTNATWQNIPPPVEPSRLLYVYQGATNISPYFSTLQAAITTAITITPTATNWVMIQIFPGTYYETIPINVPQYVSITSVSSTQSDVIIRPAPPAPPNAVFSMTGNAAITGIVVDGFDGVANNATIGVSSFVGVLYSTDYLSSVTVYNCTNAGVQVTGSLGTQNSKTLVCKSVSVQTTQLGFTTQNGFETHQSGILNGTDLSVSGSFQSGVYGIVTNALNVHDDYSFAIVNSINLSEVQYGIRVGGATSLSQNLYPTLRLNGGLFTRISVVGIYCDAKGIVRTNDMKIQDDTGIYPSQIHLYVVNPPLPNDPNLLVGLYSNIRADLFYQTGALNNPPVISGSNLSENPNGTRNFFTSGLDIGYIGNGRSLTVGEGRENNLGMLIFSYNSMVYTNITTKINTVAQIVTQVDLATTTQIDLLLAPATIDSVAPTAGVSRILVKDGSVANPNVAGYSVDNGVYLWNGAGVPMTRTADFPNGAQISEKTYFSVSSSGAINYGQRYKINGKSGTTQLLNIIIGTDSLYFKPESSQPFVNSNGNALYIGNALLSQFTGLFVQLTIPITCTIGYSVTDVIQWQYWNGTSWIPLPLGSTLGASPYSSRSDHTFAYSDTIVSGQTQNYNYRFGKISSTWATTTVSGILGYWVRAIITDATNILTIPVLEAVLLETNHTEIGEDGYIEYFGSARPVTRETIPMTLLYPTGSNPAPYAIRLLASNSPYSISKVIPNSVFEDGIDTSACFTWEIPSYLTDSCGIKLTLRISVPPGGVPTTTTWKIDYVFVNNDNSIGRKNTAPSPNNISKSTNMTITVSSTNQGLSSGYVYLETNDIFHTQDNSILWCKLTRLGSTDAYGQDVYLQIVMIEYVLRASGNHFSLY